MGILKMIKLFWTKKKKTKPDLIQKTKPELIPLLWEPNEIVENLQRGGYNYGPAALGPDGIFWPWPLVYDCECEQWNKIFVDEMRKEYGP
jgi:hypothetical protein